MSALSINAPFVLFTDADGSSLDQGYIYIGTAGLPAESNQVSIYWDAALTIPAVQPIRTLGGYAVRAGTPSIFYVDATDYSISIKNKNNTLVYQALNDGARINFSQIAGTVPVSQGGTGASTVIAARAALSVAPRATRIDVASVAGTVDLTTNAPDSDDIRITGTLTITGFTVAVGRVIRVTAGGAFTLTNNSNIVTQTGANIVCAAGDTFMLRATAANSVEVLNFAAASGLGNAVLLTGNQTIAGTKTFSTQPVLPQAPTLGTAVTTTGGTAVDFTGIPSWVNSIVATVEQSSGSGSSNFMVQLGDSGGVETSGYSGAVNRTDANVVLFSSGFVLSFNNSAALTNTVTVFLNRHSGNVWLASFITVRSDGAVSYGGGSKTLSAALDRVRLTTVNGTDTFDVMNSNIWYGP